MILIKENVVKIKEDVREIEHLLSLGYVEVKQEEPKQEEQEEQEEQEQEEQEQELNRAELFAALKELGVQTKVTATNIELKELYEKAKGE